MKVFLDLPPTLSLDSVFIVVNASNVLFIISQVFVPVMASGGTFVCKPESFGIPVECDEVPQNPALCRVASPFCLIPFFLSSSLSQERIQTGLFCTGTSAWSAPRIHSCL